MTVPRRLEVAILVLFAGQLLVMAASVAALVGTYSNAQDLHRQARQGAQAYQAQCVYKASLADSIRQERQFLADTPAERIKQFGIILGKVPAATIRTELVAQLARFKSLSGLRC